ncbi:thioesterase family protein [Corynebacterium aquilae]|uniref:thioesterase family protein n=1 Tax=Corynebacterium aquilae TaxID=203263 RepID=UPI000952F931|nr:hotdog domain-containing protein [Corynebacterium aquilae]
MGLEIGQKNIRRFTVTPDHTIPAILPGEEAFGCMPEVFTTGCLLAVMELACIEHLSPELSVDQMSVGIEANLTHTAPCTVGTALEVVAVVTSRTKNVVCWEVSVFTQSGAVLMGAATHKRAIVNREQFIQKVNSQTEIIGGAELSHN